MAIGGSPPNAQAREKDGSKGTAGRYGFVAEVLRSYLGGLWMARDPGDASERGTVLVRRVVPIPTASARAAILDAARWAQGTGGSTLEVIEARNGVDLVTPFVDAEPLRSLLRTAGLKHVPLDPAVLLGIAHQIIEQLARVHDAARDAKSPHGFGGVHPDSILVGTDGRVQLIDAGVSAAASAREPWKSDTQRIGYFAPEQLDLRGVVDARSDVFALGIVLWEAFGNRRLFPGADAKSARERLQKGVIVRLDATRPTASAAVATPIADLVARALERDPARRFQTAEEMADAVRALEPADSTRIGAWVTALADTAISKRRQLLERISLGGTLPSAPAVGRSSVLPTARASVPPAASRPSVKPAAPPVAPPTASRPSVKPAAPPVAPPTASRPNVTPAAPPVAPPTASRPNVPPAAPPSAPQPASRPSVPPAAPPSAPQAVSRPSVPPAAPPQAASRPSVRPAVPPGAPPAASRPSVRPAAPPSAPQAAPSAPQASARPSAPPAAPSAPQASARPSVPPGVPRPGGSVAGQPPPSAEPANETPATDPSHVAAVAAAAMDQEPQSSEYEPAESAVAPPSSEPVREQAQAVAPPSAPEGEAATEPAREASGDVTRIEEAGTPEAPEAEIADEDAEGEAMEVTDDDLGAPPPPSMRVSQTSRPPRLPQDVNPSADTTAGDTSLLGASGEPLASPMRTVSELATLTSPVAPRRRRMALAVGVALALGVGVGGWWKLRGPKNAQDGESGKRAPRVSVEAHVESVTAVPAPSASVEAPSSSSAVASAAPPPSAAEPPPPKETPPATAPVESPSPGESTGAPAGEVGNHAQASQPLAPHRPPPSRGPANSGYKPGGI